MMAEPADTYEDAQHARYLAPETIDEALALLAEHGDGAKPLAGGQSLLILLRWGLAAPTFLVGLKRVPELRQLTATPGGGLTIGAMVTQHEIATSPVVQSAFPALAETAASIATPAVRRQATIGGNLAHADPAADPPAVLIALDAEVEIAAANGPRRVPVGELFTGFLETVIAPGELLSAVHLPAKPRAGAAYLKHRVRSVDYAIAGVGFGLTLAEDGRTCVEARIGLAGVNDKPLRAATAERVITGSVVSDDLLRAAGEAAAAECNPPSDTEASVWYRREMVKVFVRRAGTVALERARGGAS